MSIRGVPSVSATGKQLRSGSVVAPEVEVKETNPTLPEIKPEGQEETLTMLNKILEQNSETLTALHIQNERAHNIRKPQLSTVPPPATYSGKLSEDLNQFFITFETYAEIMSWDEATKSRLLFMYMIGAAQDFILTLSQEIRSEYFLLKDALIKRFDSSDNRWLKDNAIYTRKQLTGESLDNYIHDILSLCRKAQKPESETLSIFIQGLQGDLRGHVIFSRPENLQDAISKARLANQAYMHTNSHVETVNRQVAAISQLMPNLSVQPEYRAQPQYRNDNFYSRQNGQSYNGRRTNNQTNFRTSQRCKFCNKDGHDILVCTIMLRKLSKEYNLDYSIFQKNGRRH